MHLTIEESKDTYYSDLSTKLVKQKSNPKIYWSVLKRFLNNKKIPCIPSLFDENKLVTDFRKKADIFNSFFAKQCSLINSEGSLPSKIIEKTDNSLYSVKFSTENILQMINKLDCNKAHGHMRLVLECWKYVVPPSVDFYKLFTSLV